MKNQNGVHKLLLVIEFDSTKLVSGNIIGDELGSVIKIRKIEMGVTKGGSRIVIYRGV